MALHDGEFYREGEVSIGIPTLARNQQSVIADDVAEDEESGLSWALQDEGVYYFSIYRQEELVGQIYLHDIAWHGGQGLIGYHLFEPSHRGQGTKSLRLFAAVCVGMDEIEAVGHYQWGRG